MTHSQSSSSQYQVLLVEDSPDNQLIIKLHLQKMNAVVTIAKNGKEAVSFYKKQCFGIVLMDLQMPVMDGYEATQSIREWEKVHHQSPTPIIALTASSTNEELEKALSVGCNEHLTKPLKKDDLQQLLTKFDLFNDSPIDQKKNISRNMNKSTDKFIAILDKSLKNLVPQILEIKRKQTLEIVDAITQCDFEKIQKLGHKLRGSHGLVTVNELGNQLEEAARNKDIEASKSLSNELNEFLSHVEIKFEGDLS